MGQVFQPAPIEEVEVSVNDIMGGSPYDSSHDAFALAISRATHTHWIMTNLGVLVEDGLEGRIAILCGQAYISWKEYHETGQLSPLRFHPEIKTYYESQMDMTYSSPSKLSTAA